MTPLNRYIQTCSEPDLRLVLTDYDDALKDLAAANIFPGDMLLKNLSVTRHGRVAFYDYDEICYLTEIVFRSIPGGDNADSLSAKPGSTWQNMMCFRRNLPPSSSPMRS